MNKKLLVSVLAIACAISNMSYGGFLERTLRTTWKRVLKPYPNFQDTKMNALPKKMKRLIKIDRQVSHRSMNADVSKEEYRTIIMSCDNRGYFKVQNEFDKEYYKTFTVYHPTTANILYYSLLASICYGSYKLSQKKTRDKIKKRIRKVMKKIENRFKKQTELATTQVSVKSPEVKI